MTSAPAMMPIVFCASLRAVHQAEAGGRERAAGAGTTDRRAPGGARKIQKIAVISTRPTTRPMSGESTMKISVFVQPREMIALKPGLRDRRAGVAADERVRGARRQAVVPGDQVPDDGADQPGEDDREGDDGEVDHARADGLGDRRAEDEGGDEIEERGPDHGLARATARGSRRRSRSSSRRRGSR